MNTFNINLLGITRNFVNTKLKILISMVKSLCGQKRKKCLPIIK